MSTLGNLPKLLQELQAVQSDMTFFSEYASVPAGSEQSQLLSSLEVAMEFITDEIMGAESALEDALTENDWIDAESDNIYFEFETLDTYKCHVSPSCVFVPVAPVRARGCACVSDCPLSDRTQPRSHNVHCNVLVCALTCTGPVVRASDIAVDASPCAGTGRVRVW